MRTRSSLRHPKTPASPTLPPQPPPPPPESNPADWATGVARIAVAQICQSLGFKSAEASALETLTRVAALYLKTLGKEAASYANDCNRTQSNAFDVVNALHDLGSAQGFTGASELHRCCLLKSSVLKDADSFVNTVDEIPFAKPIPRADSSKSSRAPGSGAQLRGKHIPEWLPDFPEEATYRKEGNLMGREEELALWESSASREERIGEGVGGTTGEGSGGELRTKRERVKFQILSKTAGKPLTGKTKKRRTMEW